ncbi:MAG TPA: hypothetical protein VF719_03675 [Abditibacteriaceae bacterium]|jgi:hypothetical protein
MALDMELTPENMAALGKAIARAQITAVEEYIAESTELWPDKFKGSVNQPNIVGDAERLAAFRKARPAAESAIAAEAKRKEEVQQQMERQQESNARRDAEMEAADVRRHELESAQWKIASHDAKTRGLPVPTEPLAPRTADEIHREQRRAAYRM